MEERKILVLSFDGGGSRMVLQHHILERIIKEFPKFLDAVTIFAGTSAGAGLAAMLSLGLDGNKLVNKESVESIFSNSILHDLETVYGIFFSKFSNENLRNILEGNFGSTTINSVKKGLYIPAFRVTGDEGDENFKEEKTLDITPKWLNTRIKRWHPIYYHNLNTIVTPVVNREESLEKEWDEEKINLTENTKTLVDIIMESTAAPYYFPIVNGCIDGGICNNNPSMSVLAKLLSLGFKMENIYVISFGSGENPTYLDLDPTKDNKWGGLRWAPYLLDVIFDGTQEVVAQQMYQILGDRFWRIQPVLGETISLDDASKYDKLIEVAENHSLENMFKWWSETQNEF